MKRIGPPQKTERRIGAMTRTARELDVKPRQFSYVWPRWNRMSELAHIVMLNEIKRSAK